MSTALGTRSTARRGSTGYLTISWRRIGRITTLTLALALVVIVQMMAGAHFANHSFFSLYYAYVVFAIWIGDLWESLGAVVAAIALSLWILHVGVVAPWHYSQWTLPGEADTTDWYLFAATSLALGGLAQRWRRVSRAKTAATPLVATDVENPVLIVHGHAQIVQGGGVVFDTRASQQATERLAQPAALQTPSGNNASKTRMLARDVDDNP